MSMHRQSVIDMIAKIIANGRHIQNDLGMVVGRKDKSGNIVGFTVYKGTEYKKDVIEMRPTYEGIYPVKAAEAYINMVGALVATGDVVKWLREHNNADITV